MSAHVELGGERYTITSGLVTADKDDVLHQARAQYLSTTAPVWLSEAVHDGTMPHYTPDRDCSLAMVIAAHMHGRFACDPPPAHTADIVH